MLFNKSVFFKLISWKIRRRFLKYLLQCSFLVKLKALELATLLKMKTFMYFSRACQKSHKIHFLLSTFSGFLFSWLSDSKTAAGCYSAKIVFLIHIFTVSLFFAINVQFYFKRNYWFSREIFWRTPPSGHFWNVRFL